MAEEKLSWSAKLDDAMSGPAATIEDRLSRMEKALETAAGAMKSFDERSSKAGRTSKKVAVDIEDSISKTLTSGKAQILGARADFGRAWSALLTVTTSAKPGIGSIDGKLFSGPVRQRLQEDVGVSSGKLSSGAVFQRLQEDIGSLVGKVAPLGRAFSSVFQTHIGPFAQRASEAFGSLADRGRRAIAPIGRAFSSVGNSHLAPFAQRAREAFAGIGGWAKNLGSKIAPVLGPLSDGFGKAFGAAGDFGKTLGAKVLPHLKSLAGLGKSAVVGLAGIATAMMVGGAALGAAAGKWALHGLEFKEDTLASLKVMTGTERSARRVFDNALKFESKAPYDLQTIVGSYKDLLGAGFKQGQLDPLMNTVGDIGARNNNDPEKMRSAISALSKINATGKLSGEHINMLSDTGVSAKAIYDILAPKHGGSTKSVQAAISAGKVTAEEGVNAVMKAVEKTISGGKLGSLMASQGNTLSGLIRRAMNIPELLLLNSDIDSVTEPLKKMLSGILEEFQHGKPLFNEAEHMFRSVAAAWSKTFSAVGGTDINGILMGVIHGIEDLGVAAAPFAKGFLTQFAVEVEQVLGMFSGGSAADLAQNGKTLAEALGLVATAVVLTSKVLVGLFDVFNLFLDAMMGGDLLQERGAAWAKGLLSGAPPSEVTAGFRPPVGAGSPNVNVNVGEINVPVASGQENAGVTVAQEVRGYLPDFLTNWATEHGG